MEFRILGPLAVSGPDGPIAVDAGKVRALLELLLLHANEVIPGDRLVDSLWGDAPSESAEHAIEVYISRLRRALGQERIERQAPGYRIVIQPGELDLHRFEALTTEADAALDAGDPAEALRLFREAEALWRGPALAELRSLERLPAEIIRLDELRLAATTARIDAMLISGRHADVVPELERLVAEYPFQEGLRAQHMLALYRCGRQVEALESYRAARNVLDEELGLEPGPALQELQVAILRQDPELRVAGRRRPPANGVADSTSATGRARPRASDRGRVALALIAIAAVVAAGALVLGAPSRTGSGSPGPEASDAGSASGSGGIPSPSTAMTRAEQGLLAQLPAAIAPWCTRDDRPGMARGNSANLWCDLPLIDESDDVSFDRFQSLDLMKATFDDIAAPIGAPPGECSETTARAVGTWEIPDVHNGQLLCYTDVADGSAWIVWTYERDRVLAQARRADGNALRLYRWWREARRFLKHDAAA
jgi:DNA-binding SARP family transcriptional activator